MSTDPRLRISLTLDVVACGKVGACLRLGYRRPPAAAHGPLAGCLFARPPARSPAHPYPLTRKLPLSRSRALSLSLMLTLMCCCSCSLARRLSVEHLRVLVLSCDRSGFPARHLIAGTHGQPGRQQSE